MLYRISHATTYTYSEPVTLCHNLLHLTPRQGPNQTCQRAQILVAPLPVVLVQETDYFGNATLFFTIQEPHPKLAVTAQHLVEVTPPALPDAAQTIAWDQAAIHLREDLSVPGLDAYQYVFNSCYIKTNAQLLDYGRSSFPPGRPLLEGVLDLTRRIHSEFHYDPEATTIATPLAEVMARRRGVCQDFAHLEIGCLRALGLSARYVSGYLLTNPPPGQERLVGADASHAWIAVYCPGAGWIDVDPTNNQLPQEKHITLAWGRDYDDVSPIKGIILGGGRHSVRVAVDVAPGEEIQPT
ncbi:MAG TPA: transglutaminase family protein [Gemmataceae bacterium]|jgi:transglutaminase-like putative cysteine protease|nr:transglutaminase family protein [Gemmataceae bacterium]